MKKKAPRARVNDPEGTKRNIVEVATAEFARKGYAGARVDAIAARTRTSKRMIYYYFGGKEELYLAVLEAAYAGIRNAEATLDLAALPPEEALRTLIGFTFDYYQAHPEFVRLVMNENIMDGVHMARSRAILGRSSSKGCQRARPLDADSSTDSTPTCDAAFPRRRSSVQRLAP